MSEKYDKAYKITMLQIDGNIRNLRYLVKVTIPGIYSILSHNYGLGRSDEVVNGMKEALYDFICEEFGYEATFTSDETLEWWTGLCDDYFEQGWNKSKEGGNLSLKKEYELTEPIFEE